jgi:uncharacterized protein YkwD
MAYSFCPYCGAIIPDPAWRFCPSCGGRLFEAPGQGRQAAPSEGSCRAFRSLACAAGLFLVLVVVAILVQAFAIHIGPSPMVANASNLPSPLVILDVIATTVNIAMSDQPPSDLNNTVNISGAILSVNPAITALALSRTPTFAGPVVTITGTPPFTYQVPAMGSSPKVPVIDATSLAARVHELVNRQRQEQGLSILGTDPALASLARAHSADMAAQGYIGHVNLQELDPTARGAAAGYTCHKDYNTYYTYGIAENLFATCRYDSVLFVGSSAVDYSWKTEKTIAEETVDAWMNSPNHRDNILDKGMAREGIGVAIGDNDLVFVTEDFC